MSRPAPNISFLFAEIPVVDRYKAAADRGFEGVEIHYPYELDMAQLGAARRRAGVTQVLINAPSGDRDRGERGAASIPGAEKRFAGEIALCVRWVEALECKAVNVLAGVPPAGADPAAVAAVLERNLLLAADLLGEAGAMALVEPLNPLDAPGYAVPTHAQAEALVARLGHPNLKLQMDAYHAAACGDDPAAVMTRAAAMVGHVQIADFPGRGPPGSGGVDYAAFRDAVDRTGYAGWIGLEFKPAGPTGPCLDALAGQWFMP